MNLTLPVPGTTTGPAWASQLITALNTIEEHDHSTGGGPRITVAGLSINSDLTFGGYNATNLLSTRYSEQSASLAGGSDVGCVYNVAGDLYWNNGDGTAVKITSGIGLNAASIGGIGGDYATSTASASYSDALNTFIWTSDTAISANMDIGEVTLRQEGLASAFGVTLKSPNSLASDYDVTFPGAVPAATEIVTMSNAGVLAVSTNPSITGLTASARVVLNGGIGLGTTSDTTAGNLRYSGSDIQARVNSAWYSITGYDGSAAPGVQVGYAFTRPSTFSDLTVSAEIPVDDTIPQNTEGAEYTAIATSYTPKKVGNKLLVEAMVSLSNASVASSLIAALFQDSTADALAAGIGRIPLANAVVQVHLAAEVTVASLSATTFKIRVSTGGTTNVKVNGNGGSTVFSTAKPSYLKITEIAQ